MGHLLSNISHPSLYSQITFTRLAVPAQLEANGGEEVSDELLNLFMEISVGQQRGQHTQVTAQVAPHSVVRLIHKCLHHLEHLHCADHTSTGLTERKRTINRSLNTALAILNLGLGDNDNN